MKTLYTQPELKVIRFCVEDVLSASTGEEEDELILVPNSNS